MNRHFLSKPGILCTVLTALISIDAWAQPPANDDATGAISLFMGAPCSGSIYTNIDATQAAGEPYANCNNESTGQHGVWFSFVAPPSGVVKITTDNGATGSLTDTKIGLFAAGNVSDYGTFSLIACDEDNGQNNGITDLLSTIFVAGLVPGTTYYVQVDGRTATATGTFCLQAQEVNPTMMSNSASCSPVQDPVGNNPAYNGWVTLVDQDGQLVASLRNPAGGQVNAYSGSYHINAGGFVPPRQSVSGITYVNRNFYISNPSVTTPIDVQFFVHPGEIVTYNGGDVSALNVTRQTGTVCNADFVESNGITSLLTQTANGSVNGIGWIQVTTPGLSNFYLMDGNLPLPIGLIDFKAGNEGVRNKTTWSTAKEEHGEYFELERSADSKNFTFLAKISANGRAGDYTYYDQVPLEGVNYYRLKMMHNDDKATYSKIVAATTPKGRAFEVKAVPNPVTHMLKVMVNSTSVEAVVTLSDVTGKTLHTYKVNGTELSIDMRALAQGMYLVKYNDGTHTETLKVSKQ